MMMETFLIATSRTTKNLRSRKLSMNNCVGKFKTSRRTSKTFISKMHNYSNKRRKTSKEGREGLKIC